MHTDAQRLARDILATRMELPVDSDENGTVWENRALAILLKRHLREDIFAFAEPRSSETGEMVGGHEEARALATPVDAVRGGAHRDEFDMAVTSMDVLARTGRIDPRRIAAARLVFLDLIDYLRRQEDEARRGIDPRDAAMSAELDRRLGTEAGRARAIEGTTSGEEEDRRETSAYDLFRRKLAAHDERRRLARGPTPNDVDRAQATALFAYQSARQERLILETVARGLEKIEHALANESGPRSPG